MQSDIFKFLIDIFVNNLVCCIVNRFGAVRMMMNLIAELSTGGKTPDGCKIGAPQKVIYVGNSIIKDNITNY